ncbi:MAG TPA: bifunctional (p)ppGpp synthetase/guanosine-3',5'-bis(diphosphate) 3'-pyrophosphohydrolase [Woeseiaceae bacterium]
MPQTDDKPTVNNALADNQAREAVAFAEARAQSSKSGHLLAEGRAITEIARSIDLPEELLTAALVYPLAREGIVALDELPGIFGADVTELVRGLVQLGHFSLPRDWRPGEALATQQSEALRKMLLAFVSDVRLVLIRIADQLYRMRAAKSLPETEQRALATETAEIYAPLANRLGVWQLKWELEDLSFRILHANTYRDIAAALKERRGEREVLIDNIKDTLRAELAANDIVADVTGRPKHIYSIWRKMQRKKTGIDNIFDIRAVRILVDSVKDCYAALGVVHNLWPYLPGEFDDYIANPKENLYQSLHTAIVGPGGQALEVQIRTHDMHRHAELGVAAHWRYKEGKAAAPAFDQKIQLLRQLLEPGQQDSDLLESMRDDVFEDRVYAISPQGDVVEMPAGATPLDFAYHIHTQVGHRCRGAKVNGRIVPLTYKVKNADRIEVITGKEANPSRDWLSPQLGYLVAARSRAKVRSWFRQQDKDQNRRQGKEIVERELARLAIKDLAAAEIARQLKFADADELFVALGAGDMTSAVISTAVQQLRGEPAARLISKKRAKPVAGDKPGNVVRGIGGLLCNFARCCRPVPPEDIAGYITLGRGVSIHRQNCGNFENLNLRHPERVIEVYWGDDDRSTYQVDLKILAYDRQGLLKDISGMLADDDVRITGLQTRADRPHLQISIDLQIEVNGLELLSRVMTRLEQIPNIVGVRRQS